MAILETNSLAGVFELRLNRPEARNALNEELIEALHDALDQASAASARVVVLRGEGKAFCGGADLEMMRRQGEAGLEENVRSARRLASLYEKIESHGLPVVARVQGAAVGGGVGLVAACDLAVASADAVFSLAEVRLGLVPAVISPYLLRKLGLGPTRDLALTGRRVSAAEALDLGLIQRVAGENGLDEAVDEVVRDLKAGGPSAITRAKRLLREVASRLHEPPGTLSELTAREIAEARASQEGRDGTTAFLERQAAPWTRERQE